MITEEHLDHWIKEIRYQLNGIVQEINEKRTGTHKGIKLDGAGFVSFEYLNEKASTINKTLHCIEWDMKNDNLLVEKIMKELRYRKKHPQAFNYAQFERWITDILKGGNGFPLPTKEELGLES